MLTNLKAGAAALLASIEARALAAWNGLKDRLAGWEQDALARLHAAELKATLKALHTRVVDLERKVYEDESAIAKRARELLAKV